MSIDQRDAARPHAADRPAAQPGAAKPNAMLAARFGTAAPVVEIHDLPTSIETMLTRSSCRTFTDDGVPADVVTLVVAAALSAPSKSDLQQATIVELTDPTQRRKVCELSDANAWALHAPVVFVVCADGSRIRRAAKRLGRAFRNEHLDQFMNAVVDAGVVLSAAVHAAESFGLGVCPISEIRDAPNDLLDLLDLPDHVVPVAGLALGWPADTERAINRRLPLPVTWHRNTYAHTMFDEFFDHYERDRADADHRNENEQRNIDAFGISDCYGWAQDRTRQYSVPRRSDWGRVVRAQGFGLR